MPSIDLRVIYVLCYICVMCYVIYVLCVMLYMCYLRVIYATVSDDVAIFKQFMLFAVMLTSL